MRLCGTAHGWAKEFCVTKPISVSVHVTVHFKTGSVKLPFLVTRGVSVSYNVIPRGTSVLTLTSLTCVYVCVCSLFAGDGVTAKKKLPNLPVFLEDPPTSPKIFPARSSAQYNQ